MAHLEGVLDGLAALPYEVHRNLNLIADLDKASFMELAALKRLENAFLENVRNKAKDKGRAEGLAPEDVEAWETLALQRAEILQRAHEKVAVARQTYDTVGESIRAVEKELLKFERSLRDDKVFEETDIPAGTPSCTGRTMGGPFLAHAYGSHAHDDFGGYDDREAPVRHEASRYADDGHAHEDRYAPSAGGSRGFMGGGGGMGAGGVSMGSRLGGGAITGPRPGAGYGGGVGTGGGGGYGAPARVPMDGYGRESSTMGGGGGYGMSSSMASSGSSAVSAAAPLRHGGLVERPYAGSQHVARATASSSSSSSSSSSAVASSSLAVSSGTGGASASAATNDAGGEAEEVYCYCNKPAYGDMVGCDYDKCPVGNGWFHLECVQLKVAPPGQWYCKECVELMKSDPPAPKSRKGRA